MCVMPPPDCVVTFEVAAVEDILALDDDEADVLDRLWLEDALTVDN